MSARRSLSVERVVRVVLLAAMAGMVLAAAVVPLGAKGASSALAFLGRFHMLALHVPIGVLVLALVAEAMTFSRRARRTGRLIVRFALPLLVLTGFAAVVLGLMLGHASHYPQALVYPHRNLTILGLLLAGVARLGGGPWLRRGFLGAGALALTVGAHFGGSMTHGEGYLTSTIERDEPPPPPPPVLHDDLDAGVADAGAPASASVVPDAASPGDAGEAADAGSLTPTADAAPPKPTNKQLAQSIVQRRCAPCHTTGQKGGLRLTDVSKPGKRGVLLPGNPESSSLYTRLVLPMDDDDHMPPSEKPQLTKGEIAIIRAFVLEQK